MTNDHLDSRFSCTREFLQAQGFFADGNTLVRHPAERASWIWHPDRAARETAILRFTLRFHLKQKTALLLHVTADQRFQFRCDNHDLSFGPDRCDLEHWTVHSLKVDLTPGEHTFEVISWFIAEPEGVAARDSPTAPGYPIGAIPPMAQMTWRGGFLLCAEGTGASQFNTGEALWLVEDLTDAVEMSRPKIPHYHDVGPSFAFDLNRWANREAKPAIVIMPPLVSNPYGVRRPGWCLYPSRLQEQRRETWTGGMIRAFQPGWNDTPIRRDDIQALEIVPWQRLLEENEPLQIPPHTQLTVLWDLKNYHCGYPVTRTQGGENSVIEWEWAEALYEAASFDSVTAETGKGNRNEIENKIFFGFGDRWRLGSKTEIETPALWWRSGRYVRIRIKTDAVPLTLIHLGLTVTGYPLELAGSWESSAHSWDRLMPIFVRTFVCAAHETWTDSPYYEQMGYVGDSRLSALANYVLFQDARLSRRSIELFEWSRHASGFVAERYPSNWRQESPTYSLLWPLMVRDYAWWRDDLPFVKSMLAGVRCVLTEFENLAGPDNLLHQVPGWPCVDWVPEWSGGPCFGPGLREGDSSILNLHWVLALLAAAQLEEACGDALLSQRFRHQAEVTFQALLARYWDVERGLILDTYGHAFASEHAQMFALLTGLLDTRQTQACLDALKRGEGLSKATIYGSFYLLDALYQHREGAEFHRRLERWKGLPDLGFTSTPESPEPSRSDAHAWGAHPAWHSLASIAGVRPAAPGFTQVRIAPLPGPLQHFKARVVHPRGYVEVAFRRTPDQRAHLRVSLPEEVTGTLFFGGKSYNLLTGENEWLAEAWKA